MKYLKLHDDKCVGCMNCVATCSRMYFKEENPAKSRIQVLGLGAGKFHLVACDQECRKCVAECPTQAITVNSQGVVMINKGLCVGCLACVAVCPIEAMRFFPGDSTPFKCIACGSCVKTCPKEALEIAEKEDSPASRFPFEVAEAARKQEASK
ncbi:MAG: 4Fe-4S dicluster domain-containing protein [Spirochaetales bacterium]|nr:MAG: 4Fe-4S dicluster domain-containing protein [Spirochaetales bacterium]